MLVAFYHSEYTPTRLPSIAHLPARRDRIREAVPARQAVPVLGRVQPRQRPRRVLSPSAVAAAKYYQALLRVCKGCTVIGLDVLDADDDRPTLRYISEFKREISRLETVMPKIWGLHNYSDVNRLESWRTRDLVRALGGQVWLTETGGHRAVRTDFPNRRGAGLTRAAKVLKYMFALAGALPQIKRLYVYDWTGGTSLHPLRRRADERPEQPRAGYVVVCRQLHAANCGVKIASN